MAPNIISHGNFRPLNSLRWRPGATKSNCAIPASLNNEEITHRRRLRIQGHTIQMVHSTSSLENGKKCGGCGLLVVKTCEFLCCPSLSPLCLKCVSKPDLRSCQIFHNVRQEYLSFIKTKKPRHQIGKCCDKCPKDYLKNLYAQRWQLATKKRKSLELHFNKKIKRR